MPNRRLRSTKTREETQLLKQSKTAIFNFSNHPLTKEEKLVLTRGLSFCRTPRTFDKIQLNTDIKLFTRRIRLKHFFQDNPLLTTDPFRLPSGWTPPCGKSLNLDTYINIVQDDLTIKTWHNLNFIKPEQPRVDSVKEPEEQPRHHNQTGR